MLDTLKIATTFFSKFITYKLLEGFYYKNIKSFLSILSKLKKIVYKINIYIYLTKIELKENILKIKK